MSKQNLIIVESPAKCKTIAKILGTGYKVLATMGHIRDLPKSRMGVDVEKNYLPTYQISTDKKNTVKTLAETIKKSSQIFIATDEDREGEAIGWHLVEATKLEKTDFKRIAFHEITPDAIKSAIKNPRDLDYNLINAQQARRILDRLVGYNLSPFLNKKLLKGLSAGRVQSSSLKLIVDREREIQNFKAEEFWTIEALFEKDNIKFLAKFIEKESKNYGNKELKNEKSVQKILENFDKNNFEIIDLNKKERLKKPNPPFITSTLQQAASKILGFSSKKTMQVAQTLYEGVNLGSEEVGLITYMRTDSTAIAKPALEEIRKYIEKSFAAKFLPGKPVFYKTKDKNAQEAHECIRPTSVFKIPETIKEFLTRDQFRLYELIWQRAVASQISDAIFEQNIVKLKNEDTVWQTVGETKLFNGFLEVYKYDDNAKDVILPKLEINEKLEAKEILPKQHFTEPPARYTEATLIKTLEKNGIGRPSTYAPTIATLLARNYVKLEEKKFFPEEIGVKVTEILEKYFTNIVDAHFTAEMEDKLDKVATGEEEWIKMLDNFYKPFIETIKFAEKEMPSQKEVKKANKTCPQCGEELVYRKSKFGEFVGCSAYPKCKYIERNKNEKDVEPKTSEANSEEIKNLEPCPKCGGKLTIKSSRFGKFIACSSYPKCKYSRNIEQNIQKKCPECGLDLTVKFSRRGKFLGCTGYPKCKHIEQLKN